MPRYCASLSRSAWSRAPALADVAQMADEDVALGHRGDADRELDGDLGAVGAQRHGLDQAADHRAAAAVMELPQPLPVRRRGVARADHVAAAGR